MRAMFVCDDSLAKTRIELFTTSTASDIKTKKDCYRLRALLEAKKITFTEVSSFLEAFMTLLAHSAVAQECGCSVTC